MTPEHWTCPFCSRDTTITPERIHNGESILTIQNAVGPRCFSFHFIVCPNQQCQRFTLSAALCTVEQDQFSRYSAKDIEQWWNLIPASMAKAFPDYVPKAIITDYKEACLIADLSPKASATLSRRCIQGILRDFWKVKPGRLVDEIKEIAEKVDPHTWAAIEAVRRVGNIGAHMEKDIDVIIDVEPKEAGLLIALIETLIKDWYVAREERQRRLSEITRMADAKHLQSKQGGAANPQKPGA